MFTVSDGVPSEKQCLYYRHIYEEIYCMELAYAIDGAGQASVKSEWLAVRKTRHRTMMMLSIRNFLLLILFLLLSRN